MHELILREGDLFQVADRAGDFGTRAEALGLITRDTRYLSRFELLVNGERPGLAPVAAPSGCAALASSGAPEVERRRVLCGRALYERITISTPADSRTAATVEIRFAADFADIFELRGFPRAARGELRAPAVGRDRVRLGYLGRDGVLRETELRFCPTPDVLTPDRAVWRLAPVGVGGRGAGPRPDGTAPAGPVTLDIAVLPAEDGCFPPTAGFAKAAAVLAAARECWRSACTRFESSSGLLNRVLEQSLSDLRLLLTDLGPGPFLVAGLPWFAVPFGRDALIAALQTLPLNPDIARGTLRTLAALQGRTTDPWRREEPGKIPHEVRFGEMTNTGEVPFGRYYGSVDSTPLFLLLLGETYAWTGDLALARELRPAALAALDWIDRFGGGFLTFSAHDLESGLRIQSWKDSPDSISHSDGRLAEGELAVAEVQGYAVRAKRSLAPVFRALGEPERAARLLAEAAALQRRFTEHFWMAEQQCPAIALADGARVESVASDIGHCLWTRLLTSDQAAGAARRLLAPDLFSGWGLRTLSSESRRYDPASYHNGSVWPHDTAIAALGLKRYGFDDAANQVATGLLEAADRFGGRLPELFCGDGRGQGPPVLYPTACSPQAWAAGAPLMLVQAMLGLEPDAPAGVLRMRPRLPSWLDRLTLRNLRVGDARLDLEVTHRETRATTHTGTLAIEATAIG